VNLGEKDITIEGIFSDHVMFHPSLAKQEKETLRHQESSCIIHRRGSKTQG